MREFGLNNVATDLTRRSNRSILGSVTEIIWKNHRFWAHTTCDYCRDAPLPPFGPQCWPNEPLDADSLMAFQTGGGQIRAAFHRQECLENFKSGHDHHPDALAYITVREYLALMCEQFGMEIVPPNPVKT